VWLAVVSQPGNRSASVSPPGSLDASLREFWVANPWEIIANGHNLSAYERNRAFLNLGGKDFLDISHLTGADSDGDGRGVVAADFRNIGMLDLIVRQAGGGPLLLFENRLPRKSYLEVSLRGRASNRQGIGARVTAQVGGRQIVRELYPANSFLSQAPAGVHLGLADSDTVERLTIRWPSGKVQVLNNVTANRHILVDEDKEGAAAIETIVPGQTFAR
jgi:hypothetical protein